MSDGLHARRKESSCPSLAANGGVDNSVRTEQHSSAKCGVEPFEAKTAFEGKAVYALKKHCECRGTVDDSMEYHLNSECMWVVDHGVVDHGAVDNGGSSWNGRCVCRGPVTCCYTDNASSAAA